MVNEAEKFKDQDDLQRQTIAAKNSLESYCFNMKNTMSDDDAIGDKVPADERQKILKKLVLLMNVHFELSNN